MQQLLKQALREANERIIEQQREIRKLRIVNDLMSEEIVNVNKFRKDRSMSINYNTQDGLSGGVCGAVQSKQGLMQNLTHLAESTERIFTHLNELTVQLEPLMLIDDRKEPVRDIAVPTDNSDPEAIRRSSELIHHHRLIIDKINRISEYLQL